VIDPIKPEKQGNSGFKLKTGAAFSFQFESIEAMPTTNENGERKDLEVNRSF